MYVLCVFRSRSSYQLSPPIIDLLHLHLIFRRIRMRIPRRIPGANGSPERCGRFLSNGMTSLVQGCACLVGGIRSGEVSVRFAGIDLERTLCRFRVVTCDVVQVLRVESLLRPVPF